MKLDAETQAVAINIINNIIANQGSSDYGSTDLLSVNRSVLSQPEHIRQYLAS